MVWVEKGTPEVGQLMIDAYHATGDEFYYDMAVRSARILIRGQLPLRGAELQVRPGRSGFRTAVVRDHRP